jgi:predicted aldo/keto reductase-like oxidoreductase
MPPRNRRARASLAVFIRKTHRLHNPHRSHNTRKTRKTHNRRKARNEPDMRYRDLGKTGIKVSRLALGCMRFPRNAEGLIDEAAAIQMVRHAIDHGINYLDTAYVYEGSEYILGKALQDGYRERVFIATKSPTWLINSPSDYPLYLERSLQRLNTDYADIYLLHNLSHANWQRAKQNGALRFLSAARTNGQIRHAGFSIHSTTAGFKQVLDAYDWELAQIQLNILDTDTQVGVKGLKYAAEKGVATVIMEPLRGGSLVQGLSPRDRAQLSTVLEQRSIVEWCFRWLYNMPEVTTILSGCSTLAQLEQNLALFKDALPGVMSAQEQRAIDSIRAVFSAKTAIACTGCGYCMPCPQNVSIPDVFRFFNQLELLKDAVGNAVGDTANCSIDSAPDNNDTNNSIDPRAAYNSLLLRRGKSAKLCTSCGKCQQDCPQELPIPVLLHKAHSALACTP